MSTRTRQTSRPVDEQTFDEIDQRYDLEDLTDDELEELLFEDTQERNQGFLNLPTMAGLSMIVVGIAYIFQRLGVWDGLPSLPNLVEWLPWLAGILIILLGFGVLSWRPNRKKKKAVQATTATKTKASSSSRSKSKSSDKKRLRKSRTDKKLAGVAGGLGEYLNIDPTIIRIAFVIGTFFNGVGLLVYLAMAFIMSKPEPLSAEERITIIRDS